jgi:hypothetical protein
MRTVVISQPAFFPWVGMFEQVRLADVFVHYDDVQFSKGWFTNRIRVKTEYGSKWLSVPLAGLELGQNIDRVRIDEAKAWRDAHLSLLRQAYKRAPFGKEMLELVADVYAAKFETIADLAIASLESAASYFGLDRGRTFVRSSALGVAGHGTGRVLEIVTRAGGTRYVTGHGARKYLDHERFDRAGIAVEYMEYLRQPFPQLHGVFDPHVSILDLIANCGRAGARAILSGSVPWRQFVTRTPTEA